MISFAAPGGPEILGQRMSAFGGKADMAIALRNVRL
jgi:hypothetical protein